jgi:anti-anti-sigma factor
VWISGAIMFEYTIADEGSLKCITATGRIDGLSSSEIQRALDDLILAGARTLLFDVTSVHYVSSAGLRVFISTQKALKKVGGEIILVGMTTPVLEIFKISGLVPIFRMAANKKEVPELLRGDAGPTQHLACEVEGIAIEYLEKEVAKGSLLIVGAQDKTAESAYTEKDVVAVEPARMQFGCGLAALGDTYEEYKPLFGESMIINNSFFFYPAIKHSSVDFLINAHENRDTTYKFLHGFGFNGDYRYVLSFHGNGAPLDLPALVRSFFAISRANLLGVCIIAESKGIWGMHIKQVPIAENRPVTKKSIFEKETFSDWIDFPVEPTFVNNAVVATGIAVREGTRLEGEKASIISEGSTFHIHGGIFDINPLGSNIGDFNKELMRIFNEREVYKIQHLLGQTRFSGGMAALVELEG